VHGRDFRYGLQGLAHDGHYSSSTAFLTWLYVETVQKPDTIDHSEFNAATSPYQKTAIFLNPEIKTYIKCKSYTFAPINDSKITVYSESIQLTRISQVKIAFIIAQKEIM